MLNNGFESEVLILSTCAIGQAEISMEGERNEMPSSPQNFPVRFQFIPSYTKCRQQMVNEGDVEVSVR